VIRLSHLISKRLLVSRLKYSAIIMAALIALFIIGSLAPLPEEEGRQIEERSREYG